MFTCYCFCWPHACIKLELQQIVRHSCKQAPLKLASCLPSRLALHHHEPECSTYALGSWWRENLYKKRQERGERGAPNHTAMPAREQGTSALKSGEAVANLTRGTERKQSDAALSLLQTIPNQKLKGPPFPPPKGQFLLLRRLQGNWKHLASCCISSKVSISLVAVMNSHRNWNIKMNNWGGFFPTIIFFFVFPGKVISQKFCWTKTSPIKVNAAILIYASRGSDLFFQQVARSCQGRGAGIHVPSWCDSNHPGLQVASLPIKKELFLERVAVELQAGGSTGCRNPCGFMVGLSNLKGLFQPERVYDSICMHICVYLCICRSYPCLYMRLPTSTHLY